VDTLLHDTVRDRIVSLADEYAALFVAAMPAARSEDELREALAGTMLTFLSDVAGVNDE
jgi:hypothetical protein